MNATLWAAAGLLFLSNLFMNTAWYGHLKWKPRLAIVAILISWGIAFVEYCLAVPADRLGHRTFTTGQLKILQEAMSLSTFVVISLVLLKAPVTPKLVLGVAFILAGVWIAF